MRILIVEDEIELLDSTRSYLKKQDFVCEGVETYFEAEDKLITYKYDIVILDINLPDGNGLDLLVHIKKSNPETGVLTGVHRIQYANTNTKPIVTDPTFTVGINAVNAGNTSDVIVRTGSLSAFVEGLVVETEPARSSAASRFRSA